MDYYDFQHWTSVVKTSLLILLFIILLIYILKKLITTFKKGTTDPINFNHVSRLLSLGLTFIFLSKQVTNLFVSIFRIIASSSDYLLFLFSKNSNTNFADSDFPFVIINFPFADVIIIFAVWLFINIIFNIFFQGAATPDLPKIISDKSLAKNTFVVLLLIFSIYLCIASIVAIPEFQALESSEFNNEELTEFTKEVGQKISNNEELFLLKELPKDDLYLKKSMNVYDELNKRIQNYNQVFDLLWKSEEQRKNDAIDAYKSAFLEKTATKERIKYRSQLKTWLQNRSSIFTTFFSHKPSFERILERFEMDVSKVDKDLLLRSNDSIVNSSLNIALARSLNDWDMEMRNFGEAKYKFSIINFGVPKKPMIGEQFGVFRYISGWLLRTESMSLALIVGLFAFGLLGSIGSTFIRQRIKIGDEEIEKQKDLNKDFVPNLPAALIDGISAAIVVFLAVKGSLVIFSGNDSNVNPYVLFFTCFVAAVFSADVWKWAHNKLGEQFKDQGVSTPEDGKEKPALKGKKE
jgi:flagellar biogenesis protein FliO